VNEIGCQATFTWDVMIAQLIIEIDELKYSI